MRLQHSGAFTPLTAAPCRLLVRAQLLEELPQASSSDFTCGSVGAYMETSIKKLPTYPSLST